MSEYKQKSGFVIVMESKRESFLRLKCRTIRPTASLFVLFPPLFHSPRSGRRRHGGRVRRRHSAAGLPIPLRRGRVGRLWSGHQTAGCGARGAQGRRKQEEADGGRQAVHRSLNQTHHLFWVNRGGRRSTGGLGEMPCFCIRIFFVKLRSFFRFEH